MAAGLLVLTVGITLRLTAPAGGEVVPDVSGVGATLALNDDVRTGTAAVGSPLAGGAPPMPRSLEGLELPGEVAETADGRLQVTRGVRALFDHFLSALGEADMASLRTQLQVALAARLGPRATAEAVALFDAYVAYHADVARNLGAAQSIETAEQLRARQASVRSARSRAFSPEVSQALFDHDDIYDDYVIAKIDILHDPATSVVQRAARLAELRARLPESLRQSLDVTEVVSTLTDMTHQWQQARGSTQELRQLRENLVGAAAADRLAVMDDENRVWDDKVAEYMAQRDRLQADTSLSAEARQGQIDAMRAFRFAAEEQLRINALEHIRDDTGQPAAPPR